MSLQNRQREDHPVDDLLTDLADKYRILLRLRQERERLEARGEMSFSGEARVARRAEARDIARRFPGALRELDRLDSAALRRRLNAVEEERTARARNPDHELPASLQVVLDFHASLRWVLKVKRWLASHGIRRRVPAVEEIAELETWLGSSQQQAPAPATITAADVADPPGGRLLTLIWRELSERHGLSLEEARTLVLGP